jgi:hypothetical protein
MSEPDELAYWMNKYEVTRVELERQRAKLVNQHMEILRLEKMRGMPSTGAIAKMQSDLSLLRQRKNDICIKAKAVIEFCQELMIAGEIAGGKDRNKLKNKLEALDNSL